ncbi:hypothetical protein HER18_09945 [Chryseobacterium sp. NEB161]|nr:hypothetical protein HER18_09945 [Chryseobacterium sp. NEB161]
MKKLKYTFTLMALFYSCLSSAQFNTITPTIPKKSENPKLSEKSNIEDPVKQKNAKKSWKQVLNITTKSDLKNETHGSTKWLTSQIDSLKMLIKESSSVNEVRKNEFEKLKDSLVLQSLNRVEEAQQTSKNKTFLQRMIS